MNVTIGDTVTITGGYERGRFGVVVGATPSGALRVDVAGVGVTLLSPVNLAWCSDHEHCPLHGCVEYVCCEPSR